MKKYKVLCVLPVYNAEKYLYESISSILNQSYKEFRLLIIDDGSTDRSVDIIKKFYDPRIDFISNNENRGLIYTLNLALQQCEEDYIIRMDADDIAHADRFEKLLDVVQQNETLWVVGSQVSYFGNIEGESNLPLKSSDIAAYLFFRNPVAHPSVVLRSSFFKNGNLSFETPFLHVEDYRLWTRIILHGGKIENIKDPLLRYRVEGQNISLINIDKSINKTSLIWKDYFAYFGFFPENRELCLHGILAGISSINSYNIRPFLNYVDKFKNWMIKSDISFRHELTTQFEERMDKLFFLICKKNQWLIIDYWIFRRRIKKKELIYFLSFLIKKG